LQSSYTFSYRQLAGKTVAKQTHALPKKRQLVSELASQRVGVETGRILRFPTRRQKNAMNGIHSALPMPILLPAHVPAR
jgi:hypothetical protein